MTINERIARAIEDELEPIAKQIEVFRRCANQELVCHLQMKAEEIHKHAAIARATSPWVAVADGLPEPYEFVTIYRGGDKAIPGFHNPDHGKWYHPDGYD